jgi:antitoxin component YwqK of YwqJK toxin-antitoxin module
MRQIFCLSLLLVLHLNYTGQYLHELSPELIESEYLEKYKSYLEPEAELLIISKYESVEKIGEDSYLRKRYNPDQVILTEVLGFKNYLRKILHGQFVQYYDNGTKSMSGEYLGSKASGTWKYYKYPNGQLISYGDYKLGVKDGEWITLDTLGNVFKKQDFKDLAFSDCNTYNKNGELIFFEKFKNDKVRKQTIFDQEAYDDLNCNGVHPSMTLQSCMHLKKNKRKRCNKKTVRDHVRSNLKFDDPTIAEARGRVTIWFNVRPNGEITDIVLPTSLNDTIKERCLKIMIDFPKYSKYTICEKHKGIRIGIPISILTGKDFLYELEEVW